MYDQIELLIAGNTRQKLGFQKGNKEEAKNPRT